MPLSNLPGQWRWERRADGSWWRVHDALRIEDGPHVRRGRPNEAAWLVTPEHADRLQLRCALAASAVARWVVAHESSPLTGADADHGARLLDRLERAMIALTHTPRTELRDQMIRVASVWIGSGEARLRERA